MRRKFKRIAAAAMATAMALSVAACGGSKKDSDKIILGYMGPLTGESALWGGGGIQHPENAGGGDQRKRRHYRQTD